MLARILILVCWVCSRCTGTSVPLGQIPRGTDRSHENAIAAGWMSALPCRQQLTVQAGRVAGPQFDISVQTGVVSPEARLLPIWLCLSMSDSAGMPLTIQI